MTVFNRMSDEFYRIRRLPPYVFAEVNAAKAKMRAEGHDIIDLGMGNPDSPTPKHIVDKLCEVVRDENTHGYSQSKGIPGLRKACAGYYKRRFGVDLDPGSEIVVTIGSKEGLASLSQAITAPGDIILVPNPSYPIHPFGFMLAGAALRYIPRDGKTDFIEALERGIRHSIPKPIAVILNYPCNPTTECVDLAFYERSGGDLQGARRVGDLRPRLCRYLFRRQEPAALGAAGERRERHRRRVHHHEQNI